MKYLILIYFLLSISILSQNKNKIIEDEYSEPMLIGYCSRDAFNDTSFAIWFDYAYEDYEPDSSALELLEQKMDGVEIIIVMGTWCDDSRIHIPHFYKVLDKIKYPTGELTLIAVNEEKKTEGSEIEGLEVNFVPTIILYKDNYELGRIVETPNQSLEEDVLEIITKEDI